MMSFATRFLKWFTIVSSLGLSPALADATNWMKDIPDSTPIAKIAIPGTHNAAALLEPYPGTAACQSLTLSQQLEAGVRFLDLRCRHLNDRFQIYHGPIDQKTSFANCLTTLGNFLKRNPTETVIISIKEENRPSETTRTFIATLKTYLKPRIWWLEESLPAIGKARGKMILLRRFSSEEKLGIPATDWKSNRRHSTKHLLIQDLYSPESAEEKWQAVFDALQWKEDQKLHLIFGSGYLKNGLGIPNIKKISSPINKRLSQYFTKAGTQSKGVIIVDFVTPKLSASIFNLNFSGVSPQKDE